MCLISAGGPSILNLYFSMNHKLWPKYRRVGWHLVAALAAHFTHRRRILWPHLQLSPLQPCHHGVRIGLSFTFPSQNSTCYWPKCRNMQNGITHSLFDTNENIFSAAESCTFHSFLSFDKINHCALKCIDEKAKGKIWKIRYRGKNTINNALNFSILMFWAKVCCRVHSSVSQV